MYNLLQQAIAGGDPSQQHTLDSLPSIPILKEGLEGFLDSFWKLSSCRSVGFGEGPIPWSAIHAYAGMLQYNSEEFSEFESIIFALDREYLTIRSEQSKNPS